MSAFNIVTVRENGLFFSFVDVQMCSLLSPSFQRDRAKMVIGNNKT